VELSLRTFYYITSIVSSQKWEENMNKITFKVVSPILCLIAVISAQQAEQSLPLPPPPQMQQQVQQPLLLPPPPQMQQQEQQPLLLPPPPPLQMQQQMQQPLLLPPPPPQEQVQEPPPPPQTPKAQQQAQANCVQSPARTTTEMGLYARFNVNSVSYGFNSKKNSNVDMGIGFGGGIIRRTSINNNLDVNPEIGFFHRNLYSEKVETKKGNEQEKEYWYDETEFVLSVIPVLAQFTPFEAPFYVAAGFQLDVPILAKISTSIKYRDDSMEDVDDKNYKDTDENYKDRAGYDLGIVWGLGYNVTEHFSFNFRSVVGLGSVTGKSSDARSPTQYGLGVTFF
jgi:hypothetical protein